MRKETRKVLPVLCTIIILLSSASVMLGQAQQETITASLFIAPNPVGLNQKVSGIAWIQPDPPGETYYTGLHLYITKPTGAAEIINIEDTDSQGVSNFVYQPTMLGQYTFVLHYPQGEFQDILSTPVILIVQQAPVAPAAPVVPGDDVTVYPDPEETRISLHFEQITSSGTATVFRTTSPPSGVTPLPGIIGFYYDFEVTFTFTGPVGVGLPYEEEDLTGPESELTMWHYEGSAMGDVNGDGKVGWQDLYRIMLAYLSTPRTRRWNSACDLNRDLRIDWKDLAIVLKHFGETGSWVDVTVRVDELKNIVYGSTFNLPPFGIRPR